MIQPDDWIVGIRRKNGVYGTITSQSHVDPSDISDVYFPLQFPWEEEPMIFESLLEAVESHERSMGAEVCHRAWAEDISPDDKIWEVSLELWEYPPGAFNMSMLEHSEQVEIAEMSSEQLLNRIA